MVEQTGFDKYLSGAQPGMSAARSNMTQQENETPIEQPAGILVCRGLSAIQMLLLVEIRERMKLRFFIAHMLEIAPSEEEERLIMEARKGLIDNIDLLEQLYFELFGVRPPQFVEAIYVKPETYCGGLRYALATLADHLPYIWVILSAMEKKEHINILTKVMLDMYRNVGIMNYMYAKNSCRT